MPHGGAEGCPGDRGNSWEPGLTRCLRLCDVLSCSVDNDVADKAERVCVYAGYCVCLRQHGGVPRLTAERLFISVKDRTFFNSIKIIRRRRGLGRISDETRYDVKDRAYWAFL